MAEPREARRIEPWAAAEIQDAGRGRAQYVVVDPGDMLVDGLEPPTRPVVLLREGLAQHALAEAGFVPRDLAAAGPGTHLFRGVKVRKLHVCMTPAEAA